MSMKQAAVFDKFSDSRRVAGIQNGEIKRKNQAIKFGSTAIVIALLFFIYLWTVLSMQTYVTEHYSDLVAKTVSLKETSTIDKINGIFYGCLIRAEMIADLLTPPTWRTLDKAGAADIAQLLTLLFKESPGRVPYWDIGLATGGLISVEGYIKGSKKVNLVWVDDIDLEAQRGKFLSWVTDDDGRNASYPFSGGDDVGASFFAPTRPWYQLAMATNDSTWVDPYFSGVGNATYAATTVVDPIWDEKNKKFLGVVALGLKLEDVKTEMKNMASLRSRIAIVDGKGSLVALTGEETPYENFGGDLTAKTLFELKDPIWSKVVDDVRFRKTDKYRADYQIEGETLRYDIQVANIDVSKNIKWTCYFILCENDGNVVSAELQARALVISLVALFIAVVIFIGSYLGTNAYISQIQAQMLAMGSKDTTRISLTGIIASIDDLDKLRISHRDDPQVYGEVNTITEMLILNGGAGVFNSNRFSMKITSKVRDRVMTKFCVRERRKSEEPANSMCILGLPRFNHADRVKFGRDGVDDVIARIEKICMEINNQVNHMFDPACFMETIREIITAIGDDVRQLLLDSLEMLKCMSSNAERFKREKSESETISLMIAILAFHRTMKDRRTANRLIDRYFAPQYRGIRVASRDILMRFYKGFNETSDGSDWDSLTYRVHQLVEIIHLRRQDWIFSRLTRLLKRKKDDHVLRGDESLNVSFITFIVCTVSYMFRSPEMTKAANYIINPDYATRSDEITQFLACMSTEYIPMIKKCMYATHHQDVITRLCQN